MSRKSAVVDKDYNPNIKTTTTKTTSNSLRLRIDNLNTFQPLTDNQLKFFNAYKHGDYFITLHGVAGTGKTFCALYKALEEVLGELPRN